MRARPTPCPRSPSATESVSSSAIRSPVASVTWLPITETIA